MATYDRLEGLELQIDGWEMQGRSLDVGRFKRTTTIVILSGDGHEGRGEDVTYDVDEQTLFQRQIDLSPVVGRHTLDDLSRRLETMRLWTHEPEQDAWRNYRRWAIESAALDLALRQAGRSLAEVLELVPRPVTFAASLSLPNPPTTEPLRRLLDRVPHLRFKLDAGSHWTCELVDELADLAVVDVVDFKGAYHGTPVDQEPDPALYEKIARGFGTAWMEDPAWTPATREILAPHLDRVSWDAPIHDVADIVRLDHAPRVLNMKPSRFGSIASLMKAYDYCREAGIELYGGGQFELDVGRGQIQYLASLFHPEGCNDVAPTDYHRPSLSTELPHTPLAPAPASVGFRWGRG